MLVKLYNKNNNIHWAGSQLKIIMVYISTYLVNANNYQFTNGMITTSDILLMTGDIICDSLYYNIYLNTVCHKLIYFY